MKKPPLQLLTVSRLRLAQRILVAVAEQNPELLTDHHWQAAQIHVAQMLTEADTATPKTVKLVKSLQHAIGQ